MQFKWVRFAATTCALIGLSQSALAQSVECVEQANVTDAVIYAMPALYSGFTSQCAAALSAKGFVAREGNAFIAPYVELQNETWPGAKALVSKLAASGNDANELGELGALMDSMPDDSFRDFMEAMVQQKIAEEVEVGSCAKIERALELIAPLPPENVGGILTMIFDFAGVDNPPLCPYRP